MINIDELIKNALKNKDNIKLKAYRNIKAEIQKNQTAKGAKVLTEESQIQIIVKYSIFLQDAALKFLDADRTDLASEYTDELIEVNKLLPAPVDEREIHSFIRNDEDFFDKFWVAKDLKKEQEGTYMKIEIPKKEIGNAIKYLKSKFPTSDGKMISNIVKNFIV